MRTRDWTLGALGVMGLWALGAGITPAYGATSRSYAGGTTGMELDGRQAGSPKSATGGDPVSPGHYGDITLEAGAGMSGPFYDWIATAINGTQVRHRGSVVSLNYDYHATSQLQFTDAFIREVDLPKLIPFTKDAGYFTIKIAPGTTTHATASGTWPHPSATSDKEWLESNFRLVVSGLPCNGAQLDPIAIRPSPPGQRDRLRARGRTAVDISLSVPATDARPWQAWANTFIGQGKNGPENKKTGQLTILAADRHTTLFALSFSGIGITHLTSGSTTSIALHADRVTFRRGSL